MRLSPARIRDLLLYQIVLFIVFFQTVEAGSGGVIQKDEVVVLYDKSLRAAAEEVVRLYPKLTSELEQTLNWKIDFQPRILVTTGRERFRGNGAKNLVVAYAVPHRRLIVIDYSRVNTHPFTLGVVIKHELCHLLLHHHIQTANLPRWLDEGISQWVSDGVAEIMMESERSLLEAAILSKKHLSLKKITERFPQDKDSLLLAYEESKSLVDYMNAEFGRNKILETLELLKDGEEVNLAILKSLSISIEELERRWYEHLKARTTWFTYLSAHLYQFLFFFAALITVYGFVRLVLRKRAYEDSEG
ncbi:MAG: hypothetical protein JSU72_07180 [Deltaproteobacteria bacterium]|nr:MAG: hypothetical protein JSU72_07180 [Deltaproteobacteria bacterium]